MPSKEPEVCLLCPQTLPTKRNVSLGALIPVHNESGRVHESCGDFAPGVFEVKGEYYFVGRSIARALDTVCAYKKCGGVSPTARCAVDGCDKRYHLACAVADSCRRVDDGFKLYCREHRSFAPKRSRKAAVADEEEEEDDGHAVICFECGNGGVLVCCDTCDRAVHQACAGLREVPEGDFSCAVCVKEKEKQASTKPAPFTDDDEIDDAPSSSWSDETISPNRGTPTRVGATNRIEKNEFPTPSPFRNSTKQQSQTYSTPKRPSPNHLVEKPVFETPSPFRRGTQKVSPVKNPSGKTEFPTPSPFRNATQKPSSPSSKPANNLSTPSPFYSATQRDYDLKNTSKKSVAPIRSTSSGASSEQSDEVFKNDKKLGQPPVSPAALSDEEEEELDGMDEIFEDDYTIGKPRLSQSLSQSQSTLAKRFLCFQCKSEHEEEPLLPCDTCDRVVHSKCAGENGISIGDFSCSVCTGETTEAVNESKSAATQTQKPVVDLSSPSVEKSNMDVDIIEDEEECSTQEPEKVTRTPRSKKRVATGESKTPRKKRASTRKRVSPEASTPPSKRRRSTGSKVSKTPSSFKWSKWSASGSKRVSASQHAAGSQETSTPMWRPVLCATGLTSAQKEMLRSVASKKSTQVRTDFDGKVTHVVVNDSLTRTIKLCMAIAAGVPLVSFRWIEAAVGSAEWPSVEEFEHTLVQKYSEKPLFGGMTFFFGVTEMKEDLACIVKLGGGTVLMRKPSASTRNIDGTLYLVEDAGKKASRRASLKPLQKSMKNAQLVESKWILDKCMKSR